MSPKAKFACSMGVFLVLAVLSWNTMAETPIPVNSKEFGSFNIDFRLVTISILGLLAVRTALSYWRMTVEQRDAESKEE